MSIDPDELKLRRKKRMELYEAMMEENSGKKETKKTSTKKMQGKTISSIPPHDVSGSIAKTHEFFGRFRL